MNKYAQTARNTSQSPTSLSIEALEEIVRNCQRNEERLHELERHTRHERKKAERLLKETYRNLQEADSRQTSILENKTNNDHSYMDNNRKVKQQTPRQFYVSLDDENDENETRQHHHHHHHHLNQSRSSYNANNTSNNEINNEVVNQNKHLLERVEKLLAGDGTATSSDIMSSQERQKKIVEKPASPIEDEIYDKSLNIDQKDISEHHQLQSECSIECDLSAVDHLLSERTPINNQRLKSNIHFKDEDQVKQINDEKQNSSNQQSYEQYHNYLTKDPSPSSRSTKTNNDYYPYKTRPVSSKFSNRDDELADLARRCEDLLSRLQSQRTRAALLENSTHRYDYYRQYSPPNSPVYEPQEHYELPQSLSPTPARLSPSPPLQGPPPMSLQQSLELLRPDFISRSRQRARRIRLLREQREHNAEMERDRRQMLLFSCTTCCSNPKIRAVSAPNSSRRAISYTVPHERSNSSRITATYQEMKHATKKKYDQLPEVNDRRRQNQMDEIRRRNLLRAKLFRARLRQHVVRHGRTNIDESLSIIDT